jgi:hypothetical protein
MASIASGTFSASPDDPDPQTSAEQPADTATA